MHHKADRTVVCISTDRMRNRYVESSQQQQRHQAHSDGRPQSTWLWTEAVSQVCPNVHQEVSCANHIQNGARGEIPGGWDELVPAQALSIPERNLSASCRFKR